MSVVAPAKPRTFRRKCRCRTRWCVEFGDDRGKRPVGAYVAALAVWCGLVVTLELVSDTPMVPISPMVGVVYGGADRYVSKACPVCGYPTEYTECKKRT